MLKVVLSVVFSAVFAMAGAFSGDAFSEKMLKDFYLKSIVNAEKLAKSKKSNVIVMSAAAKSSAEILRMSLGNVNLYTQKLSMYGKTFESTITWEGIVYKLEDIVSKQTNHKDLFMETYKILTCRFDQKGLAFSLNSSILSGELKKLDDKAGLAIFTLSWWLSGKNQENAIRNLAMYYLYLNGNKNAKKYFEKKGYLKHWREVSKFINELEREAKK